MTNPSDKKRVIQSPLPKKRTITSNLNVASSQSTSIPSVKPEGKKKTTRSTKPLTLNEVLNQQKKKKGTQKTHFEKTPFFRFERKDYPLKRALGIDQGYANCGFSVVEWSPNEGEPKILTMGVIETPASLEMGQRLEIIYDQLSELIETYEVEAMGCERLFVNPPKEEGVGESSWIRNKSASIVDASMVTGMIFLLGSQKGVWTQDYVPGTVKKRVTGNGRASKDLVYERVRALIPNEFLLKKRQPKNAIEPVLRKPADHESDAVAIGITTIKDYYEYYALKEQEEKKLNR